MAEFVDIEREMGEEWQIEQVCLDASGAPLRIIDLNFRMISRCPNQVLLMDLNLAEGSVTLVTDGSDGLAMIKITPAQQQSLIQTADLYLFETRALLADGTPVLQTYGGFNVLNSAYQNFPAC